jgi:hypothetical protein
MYVATPFCLVVLTSPESSENLCFCSLCNVINSFNCMCHIRPLVVNPERQHGDDDSELLCPSPTIN